MKRLLPQDLNTEELVRTFWRSYCVNAKCWKSDDTPLDARVSYDDLDMFQQQTLVDALKVACGNYADQTEANQR